MKDNRLITYALPAKRQRFKAACALLGTSMTEAVNKFMDQIIDKADKKGKRQ
jgi:hypothetical protein